MPKRIGIVPYRYAAPLAGHLRTAAPPAFDIVTASSGILALQLRERTLDGAFLSPIDYAREYQMYRLVPRTGISSSGKSGMISLFFREGARSISTVAADPGFSSEIVLAHLVLVEKYDVRPSIVPMSGPVGEMLRRADAALVAGDAALQLSDQSNKIDLVDEWTDITDLPFVHGIWVTREGSLSDREIDILAGSGIAGSQGGDGLPRLDYELSDAPVRGLGEFFRMAYYHGVLHDIPDVRFLMTGANHTETGS